QRLVIPPLPPLALLEIWASVTISERVRVEEKEKEDKAATDKELKALEVKIKALEEKWLTNSEEMQALKNKYEELNSKVDALDRELRGRSIYVVRI
ncbi:hypothetical protein FocTR4_00001878, partial [Fusarium oxysporum f. sp. cubense]